VGAWNAARSDELFIRRSCEDDLSERSSDFDRAGVSGESERRTFFGAGDGAPGEKTCTGALYVRDGGPAGDDRSANAGSLGEADHWPGALGFQVADEGMPVMVRAAEIGEDGSGAEDGSGPGSTSIIMSLSAGLGGRLDCKRKVSLCALCKQYIHCTSSLA
jgi:hypothetical protein